MLKGPKFFRQTLDAKMRLECLTLKLVHFPGEGMIRFEVIMRLLCCLDSTIGMAPWQNAHKVRLVDNISIFLYIEKKITPIISIKNNMRS